MTEEEFINEFWGWCKGCNQGDTAHTVETEEMRKLYRRIVQESNLQLNAMTRERDHCAAEGDRLLRLKDEAIKAERQRCIDIVLSVWSAVPEDHGPWKRCQNSIHQKIRAVESQEPLKRSVSGQKCQDCGHDDVALGSCKPLPAPYTGASMPWAELHCAECCLIPTKWKPA